MLATMTDSELQQDVLRELNRLPNIDAAQVGVAEQEEAARRASAALGVWSVENLIAVEP